VEGDWTTFHGPKTHGFEALIEAKQPEELVSMCAGGAAMKQLGIFSDNS
jgi:hypothetical protein